MMRTSVHIQTRQTRENHGMPKNRWTSKAGWLFGMTMLIMGMGLPEHPAFAKDSINVILNWTIDGFHAPLFLALEKGYFAEENLEVTFTEGQGSGFALKLVAQGSDYQIGVADYSSLIKGRAQELPVTAVFAIFQTSANAIISRAETPIKTPNELEGKTIAMEPEASYSQIFPALLKATQADPQKITIVQPTGGAGETMLLLNKCDAIADLATYGIPVFEQKALPVYAFLYADFGVNLLGQGFVVNNAFLVANGDVVTRFLNAITKGWNAAKEDPAAAVASIVKAYPQYQEREDLLVKQLQQSFRFLTSPNTQGQPLGWMSDKDWTQTQDILAEYGGLAKKLPVETYYTNAYIPAATK